MAEQKTCKQCGAQFEVEDEDLAFYKKISPTFGGKTFEIPSPTLCPDCRKQRRLAWRNMSKVYKRKCDFSGEEIISSFPPDSKFKVYKSDIWWSDQVDTFKYGRDVDLTRSFLEQLQELNLDVPKIHASVFDVENSDFTNNLSKAKNCYLVQNCTNVENCFYGQGLWNTKDSLDCYRLFSSEGCYECVNCDKSYQLFFSQNSTNCKESYFLDGCVGCSNCFACGNLNNKQYWVFNKPSSQEEFEKIKNDFLSLVGEQREQRIREIRDFLRQLPKRYANVVSCEACVGDHLYHCKNVKSSFYSTGSEDFKYVSNVNYAKSSFDHDFWGDGSERVYECAEVGNDSYNLLFSVATFNNCSNIFYCIGACNGSHDCFGCVGIKKGEYCILNKQYSKSEYENLVSKIIEKMIADGEWGEFLPLSMSLRGYNETVAQEEYPLSAKEAKNLGANWQDNDFSLKYDGPFFEPKKISHYNPQKNHEAGAESSSLLQGILQCSDTSRPYKIQPQELLFYIKNNLQIPRKHPDQRYYDRLNIRNPMKLYHRKCMNEGCQNEFETTCAPDRPEKVYCESCYQKSVL